MSLSASLQTSSVFWEGSLSCFFGGRGCESHTVYDLGLSVFAQAHCAVGMSEAGYLYAGVQASFCFIGFGIQWAQLT